MGYEAAEGKAIVSLVSLLLRILERSEAVPALDLLPENVQQALESLEAPLGAGATSRLATFLAKCVAEAGLNPNSSAASWISFGRYANRKLENWQEPRSSQVPVFYLVADPNRPQLYLTTGDYYPSVVDFDAAWVVGEATSMGMRLTGKHRCPTLDLRLKNDQRLFEDLLDLVKRISDDWDAGLAKV